MSAMNDSLRAILASRRESRNSKLLRVLGTCAQPSPVEEARREATEARARADDAKKRLDKATK